MNEKKELLTYIYQDADMGISNLSLLINKLNKRDNKIKKIIEGEIKGYENFLKESKKMLKKNKYDIESKPLISKFGAYVGINFEVLKDNSDSRIADMLIQGFTMGEISIQKKIDNYTDDVDNDILKLAKNLKKFQKENIEMLKQYL